MEFNYLVGHTLADDAWKDDVGMIQGRGDKNMLIERRRLLAGAGLGGLASALSASGEPVGAAGANGGTRFDVRDFGAKGDGKTSDTSAIRRALEAAGKTNGTVWFPAGVYRCHDLKVPANVALLADPVWLYRCERAGAVLELDDPDAKCLLDVTGAFTPRSSRRKRRISLR